MFSNRRVTARNLNTCFNWENIAVVRNAECFTALNKYTSSRQAALHKLYGVLLYVMLACLRAFIYSKVLSIRISTTQVNSTFRAR